MEEKELKLIMRALAMILYRLDRQDSGFPLSDKTVEGTREIIYRLQDYAENP